MTIVPWPFSPGPDTSGAYLRKALTSSGAPGQLLQQDPSDSTDLASFLKQPLSLKLPVLRGHSGPAVTDSAIMDYIIMVDEVVAAQVQQLSVLVANVLHGKRSQSVYEHNTVSMVHAVVDEPLAMAAEALGLPVQLDRNQQDASGATGQPTLMEPYVFLTLLRVAVLVRNTFCRAWL